MVITISRNEIELAIKMYIEDKTGLDVVKPSLHEANQSHATYADVAILEKES